MGRTFYRLLKGILAFDMLTAIPMAVLHEACHYGVARLLGYRAKYFWWRVQVEAGMSDAEYLLFTLGPSLTGILFSLLSGWIIREQHSSLWSWVWFAFALWWQMSCVSDLAQVGHFLVFRRWPARRDKHRTKPAALVYLLPELRQSIPPERKKDASH